MTPKRLHLPNPPGDLWEHIRSSLDEALVEILDPGEQWALGGGTLLAAEWEHRATKDIDLKLEPGTREDRLEPEQNRHYIARLEALGATEWHGTGNQLVVSFGGKSLVDLFESRSRPRGAQLTRTVNGRPERVLSSAQILAGKGRIPDFPVTRSHPPASWPSAANSSICRTYRKTAGEESRRRSPVANRWMRP